MINWIREKMSRENQSRPAISALYHRSKGLKARLHHVSREAHLLNIERTCIEEELEHLDTFLKEK